MASKIISIFFILSFLNAHAQSPYKLNWKADAPIIVGGLGLAGYGFYLQKNKKDITPEELQALNPSAINSIDRNAVNQYSKNGSDASDIFFISGIAAPFLLAIHKPFRGEYKIAALAFETFVIAGASYALTAGMVDKYRPFVYNDSTPMKRRTTHLSRNSFYGGHPSITAAGTFFTAKILSDYYPQSKLKYVTYPLAAAVTLACGYSRYKAGYHFPSDLAIGIGVGTLTGILVPHFHKQNNISVIPVMGSYNGFILQKTF